MIIFNVSGVVCQLSNLCFECMTLLYIFSYSKYIYCWKWEEMGIDVGKNGSRNVDEALVLKWKWE